MEEGKPSFTAEIGAVIRSVETEKPESERLCYDPFARGFLGATKRIIGMIPLLRTSYQDKYHRLLRASRDS